MTRPEVSSGRFRRGSRAALVVAAALVLGGCTRPLPQVSFLGAGAVVSAPPVVWCGAGADPEAVACLADRSDADAPRLELGQGQGVSVNVPEDVGLAPWVVVFRYRTASGTEEERRSQLFSADARLQYELQLPSPTDQLLRVEVQSGLTPMATKTGTGVDYAALRSWVVLIDS